MKHLLIALLLLLSLATPIHADDAPPSDDDYVVCGQEGVVCDGPTVIQLYLPMISQ